MHSRMVTQSKSECLWQPVRLQRQAGKGARQIAERHAARIPWPQLLKARELYVKWQAFMLWVRAIEEAEGHFPEWLAEIVEKRCPGFLQFVAERRLDDRRSPPFFGITLSGGSANASSSGPGGKAG
jgi:hypothetical protein